MKMSNRVYDVLKWVVTVCLPAITTLWITIASIWNIPYLEPIAGTLSAITVFLGALIGISSLNYSKEKKVLMEKKDD